MRIERDIWGHIRSIWGSEGFQGSFGCYGLGLMAFSGL